jgi:hypothetical protein
MKLIYFQMLIRLKIMLSDLLSSQKRSGNLHKIKKEKIIIKNLKSLIMINRILIKNKNRKPKEKYKQQQPKLFEAYVEPLKDYDFNIISD